MEKHANSLLFSYAAKSIHETVTQLKTDESGLSSHEADLRLVQYGHNALQESKRLWWHILLEQFSSPFIYLLIGATVLSFLLGETIDGSMIAIFLLINTLLGFFQEYRSERTIELLNKYVRSMAVVFRDDKEITVPVEKLVPGDCIVLKTGDRIPADVRFIETQNSLVDESVLTGESQPAEKDSKALATIPTSYHECPSLGFSGTTVLRGSAKGIVIATGNRSSLGMISTLATQTKHHGSFEVGISKLSKFILKLTIITLIFVFIGNVWIKGSTNFIELLIFSIALAVSVIPEALPVVMTFSLARGSLRLAKNKVIVKRLAAIESLGSVEILCTDKTGTITENVLTVDRIFSPQKEDVVFWAALCAEETKETTREPFDKALYHELSHEKLMELKTYTHKSEIPFDPQKRSNGALVQTKNNTELILRGAPETILSLCTLSPMEKKDVAIWIETEAKRGNRVLAVAKKNLKKPFDTTNLSEKDMINNILVGVISFIDPVKTTTIPALEKARSLGVAIKILTGDNPQTAGSVAHHIRLIDKPTDVITGAEFEALSTHDQHTAVKDYAVFARVSPEQKYLIIKLLQEKNEVGFLGEGINDAPALKVSNVSIVVQSASDIAREAADIVLLQKNLKVIIDGIIEGRKTFATTVTYIKATLASNFGNFYAVALSTLFIPFLPMLPIQILLVNLLSDFPMIAIATDTIDTDETTRPRSYNVKDITLIAMILGITSSFFDFMFFGIFYKSGAEILQTNWFIGSILTELVFLFSIRTKKPFYKATFPSWTIVVLSGLAIEATILLPFTKFGQEFFHFQPPTLQHFIIIFSLVITYFGVTEIVKLMYYRK